MHGKDEKMTVLSAEDMDMVREHGSSADRDTFSVTSFLKSNNLNVYNTMTHLLTHKRKIL